MPMVVIVNALYSTGHASPFMLPSCAYKRIVI